MKFSLWTHMKASGGGRIVPRILSSAVCRDKRSASRTCCSVSEERAICAQWIGGSLGVWACLVVLEKRSISCPCRRKDDDSWFNPWASRYTEYRTPGIGFFILKGEINALCTNVLDVNLALSLLPCWSLLLRVLHYYVHYLYHSLVRIIRLLWEDTFLRGAFKF